MLSILPDTLKTVRQRWAPALNVLLRSIYLFILFNSFLFIQNDKCLLLIPSSRLRALQATDLFIETLINQLAVALRSVSLSWLPRSVLEFS